MNGLARNLLVAGSACLIGLVFNVPGVQAQSRCVAPGTWVQAQDRKVLENQDVLERISKQQVVLVGEQHDNSHDHSWQLQVITGLYPYRQDMALGFEMFPRDVQPALDQWVAGKLSEQELLNRTNWRRNWNYDPEYYLPIFRFARSHHIPMVALNVSLDLAHLVKESGWAGVERSKREGVVDPAAPETAYLDMLTQIFLEHDPSAAQAKSRSAFSAEQKKAFDRFVDGQLLWDGAMAQALAVAVKANPARLVVGIMGTGHIEDGFGVPHQLKANGISRVDGVLPWHSDDDCESLNPGHAFAVFGTTPLVMPADTRLSLGVTLTNTGTVVTNVTGKSIADASGIRIGDRILSVAGKPVGNFNDVVSIIDRVLPGTWVPVTVLRNQKELELVAKFPAQ